MEEVVKLPELAMPVDWSFISQQEGQQQLKSYVPTHKSSTGVKTAIGQSGVTIATGFDIGQYSQSEIQHLPYVSQELKKKLLPYAGVKKTAAIELNAKQPLTISTLEANEIDRAVHELMLKRIRHAYDKAVRAKGRLMTFDDLPSDIQTALFSFMYQHGAGIGSVKYQHTPAGIYFGLITDQNWDAAIDYLPKCEGPINRRQGEIRLLKRGASTLPKGAQVLPATLSQASASMRA
jgi:hypothetical protein